MRCLSFQAKLVAPSNDGGEGDGDGTKQPTEQSQPESSNPNPTTTEPPTEPHQQRRRLEGEIKRLQTMISDKQTLQDGRIVDLNRKLQEATSRCRRLKHTRNESEKRLLYALVENERLRVSFSRVRGRKGGKWGEKVLDVSCRHHTGNLKTWYVRSAKFNGVEEGTENLPNSNGFVEDWP